MVYLEGIQSRVHELDGAQNAVIAAVPIDGGGKLVPKIPSHLVRGFDCPVSS